MKKIIPGRTSPPGRIRHDGGTVLSGGKDSIACYYKLIELGVPKGKIERWHHEHQTAGNPAAVEWTGVAHKIM